MADDDSAKAKENRLSEQAALILAYEDIIAKIPKDTYGTSSFYERIYKNFSTIRFEDKATPTGHFFITNNLTKRPSMKSFFQTLPTSILSFLTPSIKVYKTFFINEKPFDWQIPFDNSSVGYKNLTSEFTALDPEKILNGNGSLPAIGIKSFSYEYKGVNPAEINTNIHATMEIYFQSAEWLANKITIAANDERFVNKTSISNANDTTFEFSYSDLINQVTRTFTEKGKTIANEKYYRIKVESGYSELPPHILKELLDSAISPNGTPYTEEQKEEIKDAIKSTKVILYLTPYSYDVNFNEDASVVLKINFQAAMDTLLSSDKSDIFLITEESRKLEDQASLFEEYLQAINKEPKKTDESTVGKEEENCSLNTEQIKKVIDEFKQQYPQFADKNSDEIITELNIIRSTAYNAIYDAFFGGINSEIYTNPPPNVSKISVWDARVSGDLYRPYRYKGQKTTDVRIRASAQTKKVDFVEPISKKVQQAILSQKKIISVEDKKFDEAVSEQLKKQDKQAAELYDSNKYVNVDAPANIKFIFLGDLLDIALENLLWIRPMQERPRVYIGSIPIAIPIVEPGPYYTVNVTKNIRYIYPNLADIPISLNLLENFLLKNIIEKKRTKYPVLEFIKDIISQLIIPSISPSVFGDQTAVAGAIRISTAYLTVNAENNIDIITGKNIIEESRYPPILNEESLKKLIEYKNRTDGTSSSFDPINYLFITCTSQFPKNQITGLEEDDEKNSLLHFRMGTEFGIIKRIGFQKVDIKYQREFNARREGKGNGTSIKQFYNSTIDMFGNDIFRPGDYIYIHPNYMYTQKNKDGLYPSVVQTIDLEDTLGIGGYYLVTNVNTSFSPGQYSTTIKCSYQAGLKRDPNNPDKKKVEAANDNCSR